MRWWKGSSSRCAGLLALGLAAVAAQACLDDDQRGARCRDAVDCPYGAACQAHVCTLGPSVLRPGAHHDAGALDARIDGPNDGAASDGADLDALSDDGADALELADAAAGDAAVDGDAAAGDAAPVVADAPAE